jgi:hypothetical protein
VAFGDELVAEVAAPHRVTRAGAGGVSDGLGCVRNPSSLRRITRDIPGIRPLPEEFQRVLP